MHDSSSHHILVIDDDQRLQRLLQQYLENEGFIVSLAKNTQEAREIRHIFQIDALVLDVMMPHETGLEFLNFLRKNNDFIPVLMLTALGDTEDKLNGLGSGADDYLAKPFEPRELVLRLQAILRRVKPKNKQTAIVSFAEYQFFLDTQQLFKAGELVFLTTAERCCLNALALKAGQAVTRETLLEYMNSTATMAEDTRAIDVLITRVRRKIEENPKAPHYLQTVRGVGYILQATLSSA